jgi:hypothetical protein
MADLQLWRERLAALDQRVEGLLALLPRVDFYHSEDVGPLFVTYEGVRGELLKTNQRFADLPSDAMPQPATAAPFAGGIERRHIENLLLDIRYAFNLIGDPSEDEPLVDFVRYR